MKKIKLLSLIFFLLFALTIPAYADEISEYKAEIAFQKEFYNNLRLEAESLLNGGSITQEEYNKRIEQYNRDETAIIEELEEIIILLEENKNGIDWDDQKPNIVTNYDENGNKITDYSNYTDEQIQQLDNCRTLSFETVVEEGTSLIDDFYIKVYISGFNFTYEKEVILDESNKYQQSIYVPNGIYSVSYESSSSVNSISYDDSFVDASTSPTNYVYITGGEQIITDEKEIIKIEGDKITEESQEDDELNTKKIIIIVVSVFVIIAIIVGVIFAIKKKRELEL